MEFCIKCGCKVATSGWEGLFGIKYDNPTRKFLTNRIAAFFKFGPIKLIYSEKTPSRVKKQPAERKNNQLSEKTTSGFSAKKFMSKWNVKFIRSTR
jgi:hypothetical protein